MTLFRGEKGAIDMKTVRAAEVVAFAILAILIPQPAFAYIDPGIGSLIFQGLLAAFVTVAAAWAGLKMKILSFFGKALDDRNRDKNASR
jgi:hypothetical protein